MLQWEQCQDKKRCSAIINLLAYELDFGAVVKMAGGNFFVGKTGDFYAIYYSVVVKACFSYALVVLCVAQWLVQA